MPGNIDVGGYFEKLTRKARGGRRLDADPDAGSSADDDSSYRSDRPDRSEAADRRGSPPPAAPTGGGGLRDILRDVLGRGKKTAERSAEKVRGRATPSPAPTKPKLPPEGTVVVAYSPQEDGDPDPGEVVWTWVPFEEDPSQGKDRPVVVIGRRGTKLVGVPLTTKRDDHEAQIAIGTGEWDPKRRDSFARIWRMLDIDPDNTRREGSVLDRKRFELVVAAVDQYYDVRHAPTGRSTTKRDTDYDY